MIPMVQLMPVASGRVLCLRPAVDNSGKALSPCAGLQIWPAARGKHSESNFRPNDHQNQAASFHHLRACILCISASLPSTAGLAPIVSPT